MLLSFSGSLAAKYISLNNQSCVSRPTLINLNPGEHNQVLNLYSFMVNLDKCDESGNTFEDPSNRIFVPNKAEHGNLNVFNMTTTAKESKALKNIFHVRLNVILMVRSKIQIK